MEDGSWEEVFASDTGEEDLRGAGWERAGGGSGRGTSCRSWDLAFLPFILFSFCLSRRLILALFLLSSFCISGNNLSSDIAVAGWRYIALGFLHLQESATALFIFNFLSSPLFVSDSHHCSVCAGHFSDEVLDELAHVAEVWCLLDSTATTA